MPAKGSKKDEHKPLSHEQLESLTGLKKTRERFHQTSAQQKPPEVNVIEEEEENNYQSGVLAFDPNLLYEREDMVSYIDVSRVAEAAEDIKTALDRAKKKFGDQFGKFRRRRNVANFAEMLTMTEEEFRETGGMVGYIERARALYLRHRHTPAIKYLDFAIAQGQHELSNFADEETKELVTARSLRAKCLLKECYFSDAAAEADKILNLHPRHLNALHVKAEARYNQCEFEAALMYYHRGATSRRISFGKVFDDGIEKSIKVITRSLSWLEHSAIKPMLAQVTHRRDLTTLACRGKEQREFEHTIKKLFFEEGAGKLARFMERVEDDLRFKNKSERRKLKEEVTGATIVSKIKQAAVSATKVHRAQKYLAPEDKKMAKRSKKFALLSNSVGTFGNKLKKKSPAEKEGAKKSKSVAKRKFSAPRIDVKPGGKRIDKNLRRLQDDENFLAELHTRMTDFDQENQTADFHPRKMFVFSVDGDPLSSKATRKKRMRENQHRLEELMGARRYHKKESVIDVNPELQLQAKVSSKRNVHISRLEDEIAFIVGGHATKRNLKTKTRECCKPHKLDHKMMEVTNEALHYIGDRKEFWISHGDSKSQPSKVSKEVKKVVSVDGEEGPSAAAEYIPLKESWRLLKGQDRLNALEECVKVTLQTQDTLDTQA